MAESQCTVTQTREGRLVLSGAPGERVPETIPKKIREAYEAEHGPLTGNAVVLVSHVRGQIRAMRPTEMVVPKAVHHAQNVEAPNLTPPESSQPRVAHGRTPRGQKPPVQNVQDGFVNPYAFVPFMGANIERPGGLEQGAPLGHDVWAANTYSGSIRVRFTTHTPLLTTELRRKTGEMGVFSTRRDAAGRPIVAGASVKGAIRAVVEQVTGSRLGVFDGRRPIIRRMLSKEGLDVRLARVVDHRVDHSLTLRPSLLPSPLAGDDLLVETVSVPQDHLGVGHHGSHVYAWLRLVHHQAGAGGQSRYNFWRAEKVVAKNPTVQTLPTAPSVRPLTGKLSAVTGEPMVLVSGQLHVTGKTFGGKHDERLWVEAIWNGDIWDEVDPSLDVPLKDEQYQEVMAAWNAVIDSFNERYLQHRPSYAGTEEERQTWKTLAEGRTVFITAMGDSSGVQSMPGMITRKRYPRLPKELLPTHVLPCSSWEEMTVADRLFGWADGGQDGQNKYGSRTAYRGQCGFGSVSCVEEPGGWADPAALQPTDQYWTLAPLGQPQPVQSRFYLRDGEGKPLHQMNKTEGYRSGQQIAGHKVYPTHRGLPDGYWSLPNGGWPLNNAGKSQYTPRQVGGRYQSWLAPQATPAKVTTAITDWVAPGSTFEFTVRVDNLRLEELGALLWVLDLGSREASSPPLLKLGRGRPLGFGAVKMIVDSRRTSLRTAEQQRARYSSLVCDDAQNDSGVLIKKAIEEFDAWLSVQAPEVREAVLAAACGFTDPIIYPRVKESAAPNGEPPTALESYAWFVANERGSKWALPPLSPATPRLPYQPNP